MSVNTTKKSLGENEPMRNDVIEWPLVLTASSTPSVTDLESVCRSFADLARSAPKPPSRIKLCHGSTTVEMEWPDLDLVSPATGQSATAQPATAQPATAQPATTRSASATAPSDPGPPGQPGQPAPVPVAQEDGLRYVCAPMVGTFYRADEPGAQPLVSVGDLVQPGQPVGIFEVMKMLSTVHADVAGRVVDILVADGEPVEYQQRLMAVEPVSPGEGG